MRIPTEAMIKAIADAVRSTPMPRRLPTLAAMKVFNALDAAGYTITRDPDHIMPPIQSTGEVGEGE